MTPFRFISATTEAVSGSAPVQVQIPLGVRAVRIVADVPVMFWYEGQSNAQAALIPAGRPERFLVQNPDTVIVSAQKSSDTGSVNIALLTR